MYRQNKPFMGFTLIEALIAVFLVGTLMVPILGTLTSGLDHTSSFDHQEKLKVLARSRLNKEIAAAAFDHRSINLELEYHHVYYDNNGKLKSVNTDKNALDWLNAQALAGNNYSILHTYKIEVELTERPKVQHDFGTVATSSVTGLKAVVVKAELQLNEYVLATDSYSLFSMVNIPSYCDSHVWVSNFRQKKLHAIDPIARSIVTDCDIATTPVNIAIHPNQKFIAIQAKNEIIALNIDTSSTEYSNTKTILATSTEISKALSPQEAYEDFGIAFRPDGQYCYFTYEDKIGVFKVNNPEDWSNLSLVQPAVFSYTCLANDFFDIHPGFDGWLYIISGTTVHRIQMYPDSFDKTLVQNLTNIGQKILNLCTSFDGKDLYVLNQKNPLLDSYISRFSTSLLNRTLSDISIPHSVTYSLTGEINLGIANEAKRITLSPDAKYFIVTSVDKTPPESTGFYLIENDASFYGGPPLTAANRIRIGHWLQSGPSTFEGGNFLTALSPLLRELVVASDFSQSLPPELYILDINSTMNPLTTPTSPLDGEYRVKFGITDGPLAAMAARLPEYVLIAGDDYKIYFVDIYKQSIDYEKTIQLDKAPVALALNPLGNLLRVSYQFPEIPEHFDTLYSKNVPAISTLLTNLTKSVALANTDNCWATIKDSVNPAYISNVTTDITPTNPRYPLEQNFSGMTAHDIVALNKGGFLVLLTKPDGNALLDWVSQHSWGTRKGNYEIFARWSTEADNFPPLNSNKLAISADDSLLAIATNNSPSENEVFIYDFNSNNFGHQTHLDGLIADYREEDWDDWKKNEWDYEPHTRIGCSFITDLSFDLAITTADQFSPFRDNPGNYHFAGVFPSEPNMIAYKRFFGHWQSKNLTDKLALASRFSSRFFVDNVERLNLNSPAVISGSDYLCSLDKYSAIKIQFDHRLNPSETQTCLGLFYSTNLLALGTFVAISPNLVLYHTDGSTQWNMISNSECMPFRFKPVFLTRQKIANTTGTYETTPRFCPDTSDPILFILNTDSKPSTICSLVFLKLGKQTKTLTFPTDDYYLPQIMISPDGQTLILARTNDNKLVTINISKPMNPDADTFFDGSLTLITSGALYGNLLWELDLDFMPISIATRPFNTHTSVIINEEVLSPQNLSHFCDAISGNPDPLLSLEATSAVLASGGVYLMAGSNEPLAVPTNKIYAYNPYNANGEIKFNSLRLNELTKQTSSVYHEDAIYTFGGTVAESNYTNPTSFVQRFPLDNSVVSSYDLNDLLVTFNDLLPVEPASFSFRNPAFLVDENGNINDGPFNSTTPWKSTDSLQWVQYDFGNKNKMIVNKIWTCNFDPDGTNRGVSDFVLYATNVSPPPISSYDSGWNILASDTIIEASAPTDDYWCSFPNNTPYRFYRFEPQDNCGHTDTIPPDTYKYHTLTELKFFYSNLRRVSPSATETPMLVSLSSPPAYEYKNGKRISASHQAPGQEAWRCITNTPAGAHWHVDNWDISNNYVWLKIDFGEGKQESINFLRIKIENSLATIASFTFQGSNSDSPPDAHDSIWWTTLEINDAGTNWDDWVDLPLPGGVNRDYCVDNTSKYRFYRLLIKKGGYHTAGNGIDIDTLELYSSNIDGQTKLLTDNRTEVKIKNSSAVSTPYGVVVAGGIDETGSASTTTSLYWPDAIDLYNSANIIRTGISRSIPPLKTKVTGHKLIWHKGELYRIGGYDAISTISSDYEQFDFSASTNDWVSYPASTELRRHSMGACSFGDEIFLFGGYDSSNVLTNTVVAWHPKTDQIRNLPALPPVLSNTSPASAVNICANWSAVAIGPYIYLFGGNDSNHRSAQIIRYTP